MANRLVIAIIVAALVVGSSLVIKCEYRTQNNEYTSDMLSWGMLAQQYLAFILLYQF